MRTRVFLVLVAIAIGGAGAGIYLAIDAQNSAVSEGDVQALQEQVEAQTGEDRWHRARHARSAAHRPAGRSRAAAQRQQLGGQRKRQGHGHDEAPAPSTGGASATPQKEQLKKLLEESPSEDDGK